ncbi:peptidoglycan recognition protein family protein [Demetria terragena]|uniref:peptidoglycan recognition protein family protein n=1 Tax=Demetria terragena TaxID=63959 RepID=UPI0003AA7C5D|nr:N-acetylmuramoyl-L-alanine amidase [Demetria terragena]
MNPVMSRRTILAGAVASAGVGLVGIRPAAAATVTRPKIIGCSEWGAKAATDPVKMVGPPTNIVVHHTATPNVTDYSASAAHAIARSIQGSHLGNGWIDTGQQFTVSRGGYVLEGRHRSVEGLDGGKKQFPQGAHTNGQNDTAIGIETQGTYETGLPPEQQRKALVHLCAYLCQTYGLTPDAIEGHRDFNSTACPGDAFYATLPQLRKEVGTLLGTGGGGGGGSAREWPLLKSGASGFRVKAAQHLLREAGHSVPVTGSFDAATSSATKAFQKAKKLTADGVLGQKTWEAPLAVKVRNGSRGEAVRALQVALNARGASMTVDGVFGSGTGSAVKKFQSSVSIGSDGVVGPDTWSHLLRV